jgi:hypothetical protein
MAPLFSFANSTIYWIIHFEAYKITMIHNWEMGAIKDVTA